MVGNVSHGKGNTHKNAFGKTKGYSDIKEVTNVEDLFFEFLRVADVIKPKIIIAENVAGLTMGEGPNSISIRYKILLRILVMTFVQKF